MTDTIATPQTADAHSFPSNRTCPYQLPEQYTELRDGGRALRKVTLYDGRPAWVVTKYETARKLLADPRLSSDRTHEDFPATSARIQSVRDRRPAFIGMDPPEHGAKRRMLISEFSVRRIRGATDRCNTDTVTVIASLLLEARSRRSNSTAIALRLAAIYPNRERCGDLHGCGSERHA